MGVEFEVVPMEGSECVVIPARLPSQEALRIARREQAECRLRVADAKLGHASDRYRAAQEDRREAWQEYLAAYAFEDDECWSSPSRPATPAPMFTLPASSTPRRSDSRWTS